MQVKGTLEIVETRPIRILVWIYIISGLLAIYYTIPTAKELIQSGEWGMLRAQVYSDDENVVLYQSALERMAKNIHSYLRPLGVVMCFYYLTVPKRNKLKLFLIWFSYIGESFLASTLIASRGMIIMVVFNVLLSFVIFKEYISHRVKKIVAIIALLLTIPLTLYMSVVSVSRFGADDAGSSVFMYLGHSMLTFNKGVMGTMHDFAYGKFAFLYFIDLFGGNLSGKMDALMQSLGYTGGTGFYTFIGTFYIDWGPIGAFIVAILMAVFLGHFTKKRHKKLSDLILIVYFAGFYMNGVFVIGYSYALGIIMCFVVYFIVKFVESRSTISLKLHN